MIIKEKMYVVIDYGLSLENGEEVGFSPDGCPLCFITSSGRVIPGLEKGILGREVGEYFRLVVESEEAYGQAREDLLQTVSRAQFPRDMELKPGMTFQVQGGHKPFMITVREVNEGNGTVLVDRNHPLAGKKLVFDIQIVEAREATAEELAAIALD